MIIRKIVEQKKAEAAIIMKENRERQLKIQKCDRALIAGQRDLDSYMRYIQRDVDQYIGPVVQVAKGHWNVGEYEILVVKPFEDELPWVRVVLPGKLKWSYEGVDDKLHSDNIRLIEQAIEEIAEREIKAEMFVS